METVLLSAGTLSRFIVMQADNSSNDKGYVNFDKDGFALLRGESVFSPFVRIEAERATVSDRYVHLRFFHNNRYWARKGRFIVAESNKPEEDTTKPSCTLFEAVGVGGSSFYLNHVQSGGRVLLERPSMRFFVQPNPNPTQVFRLSFVNWDELVKLPEHVALKGDNDKYLHAYRDFSSNHLMFKGDDPNDVLSGNKVSLMPDGHVRINSDLWGMFWRRSPDDWILADSTDTTANDRETLFWPSKIDDTTIVLRSAGNNRFCKRFTDKGRESCLSAIEDNTTIEARMVVQELVLRRRVYNVRYRMEDARIFNETPFSAGTATAYNYSDSEAGIAVEVSYEDSQSRSFSRSLSLTAGVTTTIEAGVPLITSVSIAVSYQINTTLAWNDTTTTTKSVTAKGSVPVPPRSVATVTYVGTTGMCDVPFSYTQEDRSSTNARLIVSEQIDGVFRGVNSYNFSFVIKEIMPLS